MRKIICSLSIFAFCGFFTSQAQEVDPTAPVQVGGFTFKFEKPWVSETPTSSMRKGQLRYKQSDSSLEDLELVFFHMGGGVEANTARWETQFAPGADVKTEKKVINGKEVIYFFGLGTFKQTMGAGGPFAGGKVEEFPNYKMLGAIIPSADGQHVFLKMTGPATSVDVTKESFTKMVEDAVK